MNLSWLNSFFSYETFEKERELFDCLRYLKKFFLFAKENIVPYFDKETLVFLYLDSKSKAVTYDVSNGKHRKILGSVSPNSYTDEILHVRLGKGSLFSDHVCPHTYLQTVCV